MLLEEAILHGDIINIEVKRGELEQQNYSRKEIKQMPEKWYRALLKKRAFTCSCCDEPVNKNLTKEEGRPFYFKHYDGKQCSYSENSKTYETQVSHHQDKKKKDIGLTVFREILEGQLKPIGAVVERGFFYKKKLSFNPDFIVKFPILHILKLEAQERYESVQELKQINDEQVEQEMAQRAEEAKERPVHMSQEQWEWYKKTGRMYPSRDTDGARQQPRPAFISLSSFFGGTIKRYEGSRDYI